jgi:methanogenic corrinoid protein MtbC1
MNADASQIDSARLAVTTALLEGDSGSAFHMSRGLLDEGIPFDVVLFDVVAAAHADFGTRWQEGDYRIADEHAASGAVETLIAMLAGSFDLPEEGTEIVIAAAEGDYHSLGARIAAAYLLWLGYRVRYLGSNMDATDLAGHLAEEPPTALILSCAVPILLPGARASIQASHQAGVPVLAGGNGFGLDGVWAYAVGADAWVSSPREVHDLLTSWEPDIHTAELAVPLRPTELNSIAHHRHGVLAAATAELSEPSSRVRAELGLLLAAIEATVLVDDPVLLSNFVDWQKSMLTSQGFPDDTVTKMGRALSEALQGPAPLASVLLTT